MTDKKVITIQDISCYGQCSITVAHPIISACGVECAIIPAAVLSTHTGGFTGYTFRDLTEDIPAIEKHWIKEGISFDCLYTGYLGSVRQIEYVKSLRTNVIKKDGLLIVDPAMADNGRLYYGFDEVFVKNMAKLCGNADIILPNITEAAFLTGFEMRLTDHTEEYVLGLLEALAGLGAKNIILKGVGFEKNKIGVAVYDASAKKVDYYFTAKEAKSYHGTGDCYAAAFTGAVMQGSAYYEAAALAADFVCESIRRTLEDENHPYGVKFERALPTLVNKLNA